MFHFSASSKRHLSTCDERLQCVFNKVIEHYDCTIICGHRNEAAQTLAFESGKSELQWPGSHHNELPSKAVDVMPYPINWFDYQRSAHFAGYVLGVAEEMGIKLRWGGDWDRDGQLKDHRFIDYPHFELVDND
ncbi:M15 family metallopeptidase [Endozoicomonas sp. ONNA2]|uniref:M15 family metallopeptidase n=1 Tax=Endozoicomonas sp. ONNA2 TaxID=2828741 RepID=UPI002148A2FD|nr:M15 family metallopeptidase [Endozoicomonas sp. ONNA2]